MHHYNHAVQPTVRFIFIKPQHGVPSISVSSAPAVAGGFQGDCHLKSKQRQILLVTAAILDELQIRPGSLHENVVVDGLDVMSLKSGQRLQLGEALVAATVPCDPCIQMDRVRRGLRHELENRRGMFVKVLEPGTVRVGDGVLISAWQPLLEGSAVSRVPE